MNKQLSFKMPVLDEEETKMKLKKYLRSIVCIYLKCQVTSYQK
ncbi:hypothetical protein BF37_3154 [Bacillus anthracis]|nr:hypothetical protein BF37_3154 [Bacillus anthracis]